MIRISVFRMFIVQLMSAIMGVAIADGASFLAVLIIALIVAFNIPALEKKNDQGV